MSSPLEKPWVNITPRQMRDKTYRQNRKMKMLVTTALAVSSCTIVKGVLEVDLSGGSSNPFMGFRFRPTYRTNNEGRLYFAGWQWSDWSDIRQCWCEWQGTTTDPIEFMAKRCCLAPRN